MSNGTDVWINFFWPSLICVKDFFQYSEAEPLSVFPAV